MALEVKLSEVADEGVVAESMAIEYDYNEEAKEGRLAVE